MKIGKWTGALALAAFPALLLGCKSSDVIPVAGGTALGTWVASLLTGWVGVFVGVFSGAVFVKFYDAISEWWRGLWDHSEVVQGSGSIRSEIWQWLILAVVVAGVVKFVWHYAVDEDFRDKINGVFKPKIPKRRKRNADQSP